MSKHSDFSDLLNVIIFAFLSSNPYCDNNSLKYELENNLVIDFIGKWHLGQDLNMNYYCEK